MNRLTSVFCAVLVSAAAIGCGSAPSAPQTVGGPGAMAAPAEPAMGEMMQGDQSMGGMNGSMQPGMAPKMDGQMEPAMKPKMDAADKN